MKFNRYNWFSFNIMITIPLAFMMIAFQNCSEDVGTPPPSDGGQVKAAQSALNVYPQNQLTTFGASVQVVATGGRTPYKYQLYDCDSTIDPNTGLFVAGMDYSACAIQVTDASGASVFAVIVVGPGLNITYDPNPAHTNDVVIFTVNGGLQPYKYQLIQGSGTLRDNVYFSPATPETADVIQVTDAGGNVSTVTFDILRPPAPTGALSAISVATKSAGCPSGTTQLAQTNLGTYGTDYDFCGTPGTQSSPSFVIDFMVTAPNVACPSGYTNVGTITICSNVGQCLGPQAACQETAALPTSYVTNISVTTPTGTGPACPSGQTQSGQVDSDSEGGPVDDICETTVTP